MGYLSDLGIEKTYNANPFWEEVKVVDEAYHAEPVPSDYGYSIKIIEDGKVGYVPLGKGVSSKKGVYRLVRCRATRDTSSDWSGKPVMKGDMKSFAL